MATLLQNRQASGSHEERWVPKSSGSGDGEGLVLLSVTKIAGTKSSCNANGLGTRMDGAVALAWIMAVDLDLSINDKATMTERQGV